MSSLTKLKIPGAKDLTEVADGSNGVHPADNESKSGASDASYEVSSCHSTGQNDSDSASSRLKSRLRRHRDRRRRPGASSDAVLKELKYLRAKVDALEVAKSGAGAKPRLPQTPHPSAANLMGAFARVQAMPSSKIGAGKPSASIRAALAKGAEATADRDLDFDFGCQG